MIFFKLGLKGAYRLMRRLFDKHGSQIMNGMAVFVALVAVLVGTLIFQHQQRKIVNLSQVLETKVKEIEGLNKEITLMKAYNELVVKNNEVFTEQLKNQQSSLTKIESDTNSKIVTIEKTNNVRQSDKTHTATPWEHEVSSTIISGIWGSYCVNNPDSEQCKGKVK